MTRVVVIGGSHTGLTAALELKHELGDAADITVVSRDPRFVFIPSLTWVVPGWRKPGQISFPLQPTLNRRGIRFARCGGAQRCRGRRLREVLHDQDEERDGLAALRPAGPFAPSGGRYADPVSG